MDGIGLFLFLPALPCPYAAYREAMPCSAAAVLF